MPALNRITPIVLTLDEEPNIGRTLARLTWASSIIVVDSGSRDSTVDIVRGFENARVSERQFDTHHEQWNFGLTQVETEWALALDADYQVPAGLVAEIGAIPDRTAKDGFFARFHYAVFGRRLRRSLYPPRQVLFRANRAVFENDGHTQRVRVKGSSGWLSQPILHDDRKSFHRWLRNQAAYARREAAKLEETSWSDLSWPDRIRKTRLLAPPLVFLYTLLGKRLILDGWPGWYYAIERALAEMMLSLQLVRRSIAVADAAPYNRSGR